MNAQSPILCLNMIVKNEAAVIRRCLDSVRPIIGRWVIVDTGSTDGTQDIIREHLSDLPGELYERPWRDFAYNRSEALTLARGKGDYTLIIDADDTLEILPGATLPALNADSYTIEIEDTVTVYRRTQLVRSALPWRYEGVLHEFITCEEAGPFELLTGIRMRRHHDGARRKDPETYRRDAAVLEAALRTETNPFLLARYRFYLAQSYRDCREWDKALEHYLARAALGFWQEEIFVSLYCAAQLKEQLGHPEQEVIDAYLGAAQALPTRAEALHGASRFCRQTKRYEEGYRLARRGLEIPMPPDALFVEPWIYEIGLLDEFSVNAYWSGHYRDCLEANLKLLASGKLSAEQMPRIIENARFASGRLPGEPNLGSFGTAGAPAPHALAPPRPLHSRLAEPPPRVLVAILAKQKEEFLPLYLDCIESLDYPKSSIVLYIRTNNNTDGTERLLREWVGRVGALYAGVEFDAQDVETRVEQFGVHEWNATRFQVLGHIRGISLGRALAHECDFYFVADVDNFIRPCTLRELVALDLPIVAPFLRSIGPDSFYSNYHAEIDGNGYYHECDQYAWIFHRWVRGVLEVPVVHCTYLVRADVLRDLTYGDGTPRHEYVVFSESARKAGIPQYFDNRQVYGYIVFAKGHELHVADDIERARDLLGEDPKRGNGESSKDEALATRAAVARIEAGLSALHRDPARLTALRDELEAERRKHRMTREAVAVEVERVDAGTADPDRLIDGFRAVFAQYLAIKAALARPVEDAGDIGALKRGTIAALDAGNLLEATGCLTEIRLRRQREASERGPERPEALQREAVSCALLARIALARRDVAAAVGWYEDGLRVLADAAGQRRFSFAFEAAGVLRDFGERTGRNDALEAVIAFYRHALDDAPPAQRPNDWGATQNNLGNTLQALGIRESGTARLEEAIAAYDAAIDIFIPAGADRYAAICRTNRDRSLEILEERQGKS
ncbi:MAG TPA: glycosyltransferase [Stellaceae bacterium]|nr:glycosyltransferase [Stellaceae bacterium]